MAVPFTAICAQLPPLHVLTGAGRHKTAGR